jgi:hypothetical protein
MGSYTTNFLWNHPKPGDGLYNYSDGMINTPDTPETLNFTKNQLPVIDTSNPQVNKMSMFPDMSNVNWRGNIFQGDARGYGNTGITTAFNPNNMPAMVGRTNWTPDNIIEETETETETINPYRSETEKFKTRFNPTQIEAAPEKRGIWDALRTGGSQIKDFALGATSKIPFVGPAIDFIGDQFEYRPAGIYTDEEGNVYNPEALDKMNARGGWYTEPARASRRRDARIANMLERQRLGKRISDNNLARLQEQQRQEEAARATAAGAMQDANRTARTGGYQSSFGGDRGFMEGPADRTAFSGDRDLSSTMGSFKQGGRVGLYAGGDPEEVQEDLNIYQFMQDQGVPYGDQASAVDPMDALNDMSMEIFGKPLHELTGEQYQMLIDLANDQASGPQEEIVEEGIASLV